MLKLSRTQEDQIETECCQTSKSHSQSPVLFEMTGETQAETEFNSRSWHSECCQTSKRSLSWNWMWLKKVKVKLNMTQKRQAEAEELTCMSHNLECPLRSPSWAEYNSRSWSWSWTWVWLKKSKLKLKSWRVWATISNALRDASENSKLS